MTAAGVRVEKRRRLVSNANRDIHNEDADTQHSHEIDFKLAETHVMDSTHSEEHSERLLLAMLMQS